MASLLHGCCNRHFEKHVGPSECVDAERCAGWEFCPSFLELLIPTSARISNVSYVGHIGSNEDNVLKRRTLECKEFLDFVKGVLALLIKIAWIKSFRCLRI